MAARTTTSRGRSSSTKGRGPWWRRGIPAWVVLAAVVVVGAIVLVAWLVNRPSALERRTEELRAETVASDQERAEALVDTVLAVTPEVQGLFDELAGALPPEDGSSTDPVDAPATAEDVERWRQAVDGIHQELEATEPASTAINVARAGLLAASDQLAATVALLDLAIAAPDDDGAALLAEVAVGRSNALETWNVAAIQVDAVSIDHGLGHQHVYLSPVPGEEADPGH